MLVINRFFTYLVAINFDSRDTSAMINCTNEIPSVNLPPFTSGLQGRLLVAMPDINDPRFEQTLTLICHHDQHGALGLVINQTSELLLGELCSQLDVPVQEHNIWLEAPIHAGGPLDKHRGFLLHADQSQWEHTLPIGDSDLQITTSVDALRAIAQGLGPQQFIFALGYAGWRAGQLEQELAENVWLTVDADARLVFNTPVALRWEESFHYLGFNLANFCPTPGRA